MPFKSESGTVQMSTLACSDAGVQQGVALADVAINHAHFRSSKPSRATGLKSTTRDIADQIGRVPLHFLEQRTGGAEKAEEENARLAMAVAAFRVRVVARAGRDRAGRAPSATGSDGARIPSDLAMPKVETAASRVKASATMPLVAGFAKWCGLRAEREDDEREFADLARG